MQVADVFASDQGGDRVGDLSLVQAEAHGLGAVNREHPALHLSLAAIIDIDDVGSLFEDGANLAGNRQLPRIIDAVDLRDQWRQHRRARRHFDNPDICRIGIADALQRFAQGLGDLMAVAVTLRLVPQVELNIGQVGCVAQVVLAHQSIEIDRRRGADIGLVINHLGKVCNVIAELTDHARTLFQTATLGQVDQNLYLGLVVEGQHFQHHQLEPGKTHRRGNQQQYCEQ